MADIDLKTETPDTTLPATGFLFGADSQASASPSVYSTQAVATTLLGSTTLSGTTITADAPVLNLTQTWNNAAVTFTGAKLNITDTASNPASLLMDLQVGGATRFNVTKAGGVNIRSVEPTLRLGYLNENQILLNQGTAVFGSLFRLGFSSSSIGVTVANIDTILTRRAAANLRLGAADAAAPVAQTLSVQSVVAGNTNTAGTNFTFTGSQGTGTGAGGSLIFQVAPAGSSGSAQNALQNVFLLPGASGEARLVNSAGGSADFKICSTSNTNVHLTIKHGTDASGASGTTTGFIGRISSSFGFFDGSGSLIFGQPSGSTDSISIWGTDCRIARDAANTLALRNGTAAQEFRVYETTTGTIYKAILGNRQLMKIAGAAFDNGAGANAGTLANSPVTGNPTKWIPIDDNGTTRYIPAW